MGANNEALATFPADVEGSAFGAVTMANFRYSQIQGSTLTWSEFLDCLKVDGRRRFDPKPESVAVLEKSFVRYKKLMLIQPLLCDAMHD